MKCLCQVNCNCRPLFKIIFLDFFKNQLTVTPESPLLFLESDASSDSEGELSQSILKNYRKKAKCSCQSVLTQTKEFQPSYQTGIYYEHDEREMDMSHIPNEKQTQTIIYSLLKKQQIKSNRNGRTIQINNLPHIYRKFPCPNFSNEQQILSNNSYNKQMPLIKKKWMHAEKWKYL